MRIHAVVVFFVILHQVSCYAVLRDEFFSHVARHIIRHDVCTKDVFVNELFERVASVLPAIDDDCGVQEDIPAPNKKYRDLDMRCIARSKLSEPVSLASYTRSDISETKIQFDTDLFSPRVMFSHDVDYKTTDETGDDQFNYFEIRTYFRHPNRAMTFTFDIKTRELKIISDSIDKKDVVTTIFANCEKQNECEELTNMLDEKISVNVQKWYAGNPQILTPDLLLTAAAGSRCKSWVNGNGPKDEPIPDPPAREDLKDPEEPAIVTEPLTESAVNVTEKPLEPPVEPSTSAPEQPHATEAPKEPENPLKPVTRESASCFCFLKTTLMKRKVDRLLGKDFPQRSEMSDCMGEQSKCIDFCTDEVNTRTNSLDLTAVPQIPEANRTILGDHICKHIGGHIIPYPITVEAELTCVMERNGGTRSNRYHMRSGANSKEKLWCINGKYRPFEFDVRNFF